MDKIEKKTVMAMNKERARREKVAREELEGEGSESKRSEREVREE